ncbi:hypothetical protein LTR17_002148 [Elasticomyces elasticus]|nr:hypothetical protein LTR17_002148 [Elasticomyces elasticus]
MHALLPILLPLASLIALARSQKCPPAITIDKQPQVFVMSDISNEPDDTMSFIRLLLHADQYNITGMVAVTSYWQNSSVYPDQILNTTRAYGEVVSNLNLHSAGSFPTAEYLSSVVKAGQPVYGTAGLGRANISSGALHLIDVVDSLDDDGLLHCQAWGGMSVFGEALFYVQRNRIPHELNRFTRKLRVYTISDQDNVGAWVRLNFPEIPYIVSLHGWNQYNLAAWSGISGDEYYNFDVGGPDSSLVNQEYVSTHFQLGPLGSHYPDIAFIMEGDSPSLMHTMMNGLNGGPVDHPEWGGWGGRYILHDLTRQTMIYSDAVDIVLGFNGRNFTSNHATIWRWRQAYQDEMSARVQWSIQGNYSAGSHPPVVSVNESCGSEPLIINNVYPEQVLTFDASGTYDPDANQTGRNSLSYHWFHYREPSATQTNINAEVPWLNFTLSNNGTIARTTLPSAEKACAAPNALQAARGVQETCQQYHVILEVTGSGTPPIRRYKRIVLDVQPAVSNSTMARRRKRDEL